MRFLSWSVILFVLWMALTGSLELSNITVGVLISLSVALLQTRLFVSDDFKIINPIWGLVYLWVLFKNLWLSNLRIAKRTLSKDMKLSPAIVAVKTELKSDWKKLLLANSITLTPGTLTLDIKEDRLYIHVIEYREGDCKEDITKEFEEIIAKL